MSERPLTLDPSAVSPEEFAKLVASASDEQIATAIRAMGTATVLDRIFQLMQQRFLPSQAKGLTADIQYAIADQGETHFYLAEIRDEACATRQGQAASPRVTVSADLVSFIKMTAGQAEGPALFMAGKLKIAGDLALSLRLMTLFERPRA